MKSTTAFFLVVTASSPTWAASSGGAAATAPSGGDGSSQSASPKGFDVSGSHPLPNAGEQEPPGRGACACRLTGAPASAKADHGAALVAALAAAMVALRRRGVA